MLAAALLGGGSADAGETFYASEYLGGPILVGQPYGSLVVDIPLAMTSFLDVYDGAMVRFDTMAHEICQISIPGECCRFNTAGSSFNFILPVGAENILVDSQTPLTLITAGDGLDFIEATPDNTSLLLNGAEYGAKVNLAGVEYTYVAPVENLAALNPGQVAFIGYYDGSPSLGIAAKAPAVPEPATGTLALLALTGPCARRRRKQC